MTTAIQSVAGGGRKVADRLKLSIVGTEGHDLKSGCEFCGSSDAARVHKDTGAYFCFSCQKSLSAWEYCEQRFGRDQAKQVMVDVGFFPELLSNGKGHNNGNAKAAGPALTDNEIIDQLAQRKGTTGDGFRFYGAKVENGAVVFPTYRLDGTKSEDEILTRISSCTIDPRIDPATDPDNPLVKGKNTPGRPAGIFLPYGERPGPGERWVIGEGPKNCA